MADLDFMYASERPPTNESPEDYCRRNNFPPPQADPTAWSLPVTSSANSISNNRRGADVPFPTRSGAGVADEGPLIRILIAVVVLCVILCGVLVYVAEDPVWSASMGGSDSDGATAAAVAGDASSTA